VAVDVAALAISTPHEVTHSLWSMFWWRMRHNPKAIVGGVIVVFLLAVAVTAPVIAPHDPNDGELADSLAPPGQSYLLGADKNGRDFLSRLIYGTRTALGDALMIVVISEVIGVPIGIWAAYRGGWIDETITRVWDMLLAFPPLLLAFAVVAAFGPGLPKAAMSLGILYVPFIARVVRSVTLVQKEMAYTEAARAWLRSRAHHLSAHSPQLCLPDHCRLVNRHRLRPARPGRAIASWARCAAADRGLGNDALRRAIGAPDLAARCVGGWFSYRPGRSGVQSSRRWAARRA
jgi:ABC-type dipeptide/oligopeptide/nickel transport system permease subunit